MKVILSRKGCASQNGRLASPILPSNRIISLPIPSSKDTIKYSDLIIDDSTTYYSLISSLQQHNRMNQITSTDTCHVDPDIYPAILKRKIGWKPLFGQAGAAQTHIKEHNITVGDLFLFFGWFKHTIYQNNELIYDKTRPYSLHVLFGYFQIGKIITDLKKIKPWMEYHPHCNKISRQYYKNNCLYIAKDTLSCNSKISGAGVFHPFNENLVLTKKEKHGTYMSRSKWFFTNSYPFGRKIQITYHNELSWKDEYFQSASIGQEFILEETKSVENWAKSIIMDNIV